MNKQQLANKIWKSANNMRSKIEASEYKDFILGFIFYKYVSEAEERFAVQNGMQEDEFKDMLVDTELSGMGYEICLFEENERNPWIRSLAGDKTTMKDKDQYEILKNKRDLLFKLIRTLQERKVKLEKGTKE
jgi:type I restriction-modification system DNA methylase subunit